MLINYKLKEDGETFEFYFYPADDSNLPKLDVEDPTIIKAGVTKLINGQIVNPSDDDIKLQQALNTFRSYRDMVFRRGFDIWEKNVLRGREQDDNEIMAWYYLMLDFPNQITKDTTFEDYPIVPEKIKKYLGVE